MNETTLTLVTVGMPFLLAIAGFLFTFLLSLLPVDQQDRVKEIVNSVVRSVEQSMPGATPEEKKANAIKLVNALLKASKLPVDPTLVDVLIEEAVFHLPPTNTAGAGVPVQPGA